MNMKIANLSNVIRGLVMALLAVSCLQLAGCNANVGVGLSVGVPVGNNGYMSVSGSRWN
jgi:predicted small secreted protein